MKGQGPVLAIHPGPQGTTGKPTNNRAASLHNPVRCSAPQQRRGKIHISGFKKTGETPPHHVCEEKACISISEHNSPVSCWVLRMVSMRWLVSVLMSFLSLQRGSWSTSVTMQ